MTDCARIGHDFSRTKTVQLDAFGHRTKRERYCSFCGRTRHEAVLEALDARPDYWRTDAADLVAASGLTQRGVQQVLYHLVDAGTLGYDEGGYYRKPTREGA